MEIKYRHFKWETAQLLIPTSLVVDGGDEDWPTGNPTRRGESSPPTWSSVIRPLKIKIIE